VAEYAEGLARARNLSKKDVEDIMTAALMHDIGKVMIPSEILMKADKLTSAEMKEIRKHPETGYQILKGVDDFSALSELILCHHERWDGKGYPRGLKGTEIPLGARIIAVADAFETMTGDRSYRMKKTVEEAVEELQRMRGTQFDPDMVDLFIAKVLKR
jgi:HD-GYP domain-containing protein (c-di-GMP phosphodiesterase class II)